MATASSGDIMATPLLTVTVNSKSPYGTLPSIVLPSSSPAITYSPASEASNVTGTLSCTTTANDTSPVDVYPVANCSGLADDGFNVVYDYDNSSHTVVKADQSITFAPLADTTWGDLDFAVSATSSSSLLVTFAATGNCTLIAGVTVHATGAGSCSITASQAGDARYNAASDVTRTFTIKKATQTISFTGPDPQTFGNSDFEIDPTANSGLPVTVVATSGPCTVSSATAPSFVHITGAGACTITASQSGDSNYLAGRRCSADRSRSRSRSDDHVRFARGQDVRRRRLRSQATASSGLPVSFAAAGAARCRASTVHITGAGSCTVTASQAGDANYNPAADVAQSFAIEKADQTITFAALADKTFGDPDFTVSATASSGLAGVASAQAAELHDHRRDRPHRRRRLLHGHRVAGR